MRRIRTATLVLVLVAACSPPRDAAPPAQAPAEAPATAIRDTAWSTADRRGGAASVQDAPTQVSARVASHPGFDRAVFEFSGTLPPYQVRYVDPPLEQCGSGDPVSLQGGALLVVTFSPARAHDEQGRPSVRDRALRPGLAAIRELRLVCDFEGEVTWAVGAASRSPFRVSVLRAPARLVVDVRPPGAR